MKKTQFKIILLLITLIFIAQPVFAFWMWTPETNKWVNPKYAVKDTPAEQLEYAMGYFNDKEYDKAIREFEKLIKNYPKSKEAPEAQFYWAQSLEEKGELFNAFKQYQMVIDKYPFSERSPEVVERQYEIGNMVLEGRKSRGKFMTALGGDNYDVVEIFRAVIKNAPYGKLASQAQYKIGLYLLENKLYQEARDEFEKVINDYPDSQWAKAARYQIAVSDASRSTEAQYDQKITEVAVDEFMEIVKTSPDAELSDKAKQHIGKLREKEAKNAFLIAEFYKKQKKYKSAKIYYQSVVDNYKNTKWASKALKQILKLSNKDNE